MVIFHSYVSLPEGRRRKRQHAENKNQQSLGLSQPLLTKITKELNIVVLKKSCSGAGHSGR